MIKVAVTGAAGRMGSGIIRKITEQDDMEVVAAIEIPETPLAGEDAGVRAGIGEIGVKITGAEKLEETLKETNPDVLVDFTIAHAAAETVKKAASCGVNLVVGTTGFSDEQMESNIQAVKDNNIGAVISSNMAIGVTMTAFETIAEALERDPEEVGVFGRKGMVGQRTKQEIGVHAIRGGDIVGDHTAMFIGDGERIEFTHRAHTREVFIAGVIRAIRYVPTAEKGVVSSMNDVLGLE